MLFERSEGDSRSVRRWATALAWALAAVGLCGCLESSGVEYQQPFLSATLSDVLLAGASRCQFTLRFSALEDVAPVAFAWQIDETRSTVPHVQGAEASGAGSFYGDTSRMWEWRRPDNNAALIMNVAYSLHTEQDSVGGRLITYCP